jgi:aminoglycoside 2''-phosphotransferase
MNNKLRPLAWSHGFQPDVQRVEALGEGDYCICYLVNGTHVLRIAKHVGASAALRREMLLLPRLAERIDVRIPEIQGAGERADTGEQFVFYPLVPGIILESEVLSSLELKCRSDLVRQMAGFAKQLHSFPVETISHCGLREMDPRQYLREMMRRASDTISHRLDTGVWRYYRQLVELYFKSPELQTYTRALLHGDLSPGHFLADLERCTLTGVIDFSDGLIGDPYWDLIFVLEDYGKDILELFLTYYCPDEQQQANKRVQIFQQLDNLEYCMSKLAEGDEAALEAAINTLVIQATTQNVL